jgi:hypothetical protein
MRSLSALKRQLSGKMSKISVANNGLRVIPAQLVWLQSSKFLTTIFRLGLSRFTDYRTKNTPGDAVS